MKYKTIKSYIIFAVLTISSASCYDLANDLDNAVSRGQITTVNGLTLDGNRDDLYDSVKSSYRDSSGDARVSAVGMDIEGYWLAQDATYLWIYVSFNDGSPVEPASTYSCYYVGYISSEAYGDYQLCVDYDSDDGWSARLDNVLDDSDISIPVYVNIAQGIEMRINKSQIFFNIFEFDFSSYNYCDNTAIRKYWID